MRHPMMPNAQENAYRLAAVVMTMAMCGAAQLKSNLVTGMFSRQAWPGATGRLSQVQTSLED